ncbi:hypothetical protein SCLARK_001481 [Spiroplasma clarkii]|nr:hypothetical protein [Spiroplasma clarkii]ARU91998.1 hypothetical protein SCLARK_001481 [Spiroplasma clarkii]
MYYLEANASDGGTLQIEGGNYQKTTQNVSELILDKNNWSLVSKSSSGLADEVFNTVSSNLVSALGSMSYYDGVTLTAGASLFNDFMETIEIYFDKLVKFFENQQNLGASKYGKQSYAKVVSKTRSDLKKSSLDFKEVLKKYQLDQEIEALWNGLTPLQEMEQNKK